MTLKEKNNFWLLLNRFFLNDYSYKPDNTYIFLLIGLIGLILLILSMPTLFISYILAKIEGENYFYKKEPDGFFMASVNLCICFIFFFNVHILLMLGFIDIISAILGLFLVPVTALIPLLTYHIIKILTTKTVEWK